MRWPIGAGLHHADHDLAARVAGTGDVILFAVDHPFITVKYGATANILGIRGCNIGFGHRICRANLAGEQRFEPLLFLLGCTNALKYFHIAGIRCTAVKALRSQRVLAQLVGDIGVVEV